MRLEHSDKCRESSRLGKSRPAAYYFIPWVYLKNAVQRHVSFCHNAQISEHAKPDRVFPPGVFQVPGERPGRANSD
jgi:hypothetical protein